VVVIDCRCTQVHRDHFLSPGNPVSSMLAGGTASPVFRAVPLHAFAAIMSDEHQSHDTRFAALPFVRPQSAPRRPGATTVHRCGARRATTAAHVVPEFAIWPWMPI